MPLHLAPVGRFLRHVAELFHLPLSAEALLTLLKHPITHTGADRGPHLRLTRELELHIRRHGPPYPTAQDINAWAAASKDPHAEPWAAWLIACFTDKELPGEVSLVDRTTRHIALAEQIARGADGETTGKLWADEDGAQALRTVSDFAENAPHGGAINARDYTTLFHAILSRGDVRKTIKAHPLIRIWGTLEARVQGADLLILAGLNEGSWPESPSPDPWLNRDMRAAVGLLLPERRIGLAAHDFQQALLAPEVWITRSIRSDDTETVPSRWLNRLQNLLSGLPDQGGKAALDQMRQRGRHWLDLAKAFEDPGTTPAETRPSPRPPTAARPKQLSVTQIQRLIRDPYAIYARHVLRLEPLDPLMRVPDALLRGTVIHEALERFIDATRDTPAEITRDRLIAETAAVLAEAVPWADTRAMWQAKLERAADTFIEGEHARRQFAQPAALEAKGAADLPELDFRLTAKADRIDIDPAGNLHLYDYKTGRAPGDKQQKHFDKQLLLSAAIATQSGFAPIAPAKVARATFISLGSGKPEEPAPLDTEPPEKVWNEFRELIARYMSPDLGYTSRRAPERTADTGDYDQLARFGEWDITDDPDPREVGQ